MQKKALYGLLLAALVVAPFAAAFNLLIGFAGLLSFGHAISSPRLAT